MNPELAAGLALFALVSSITPGPNNLMLMASGAHHGMIRTLPHLAGVTLGFVAMLLIIGSGVSDLLARHPMLLHLLRVASVMYLGYLALKLVRTRPLATDDAPKAPMGFLEATLFQWINPKSWAMALTALSAYAPATDFVTLALVAVIFGLINLPSVGLWAIAGQRLRTLLTCEIRLQRFNVTMATLLIASLLPLIDV